MVGGWCIFASAECWTEHAPASVLWAAAVSQSCICAVVRGIYAIPSDEYVRVCVHLRSNVVWVRNARDILVFVCMYFRLVYMCVQIMPHPTKMPSAMLLRCHDDCVIVCGRCKC